MTLEKVRQIFVDQDPAGFIYQGEDEDIYDKVAESTYNFLSICDVNQLTSHTLATRIQYLLVADSFHIMVRFDECERLANVVLRIS